MDLRKQEEQLFHNILRSDELKKDEKQYDHYTANSKYYSIDRGNRHYVYEWLKQECAGKKVLDYCCGDGRYTFLCAEYGANAHGIDISDVTIDKCRKTSAEKGLGSKTTFWVMDAEDMEFDDDYFDIILCMGVLHHLDLKKAFKELSRVLKPDGRIICTEALGHNPVIQLYRNRTPHLRTEYEAKHIIRMSDLRMAKEFFGDVETRFFHLATLAAVPFRNMPFFSGMLSLLEGVDRILLKIPLIRTQSWMVVFELSKPQSR